LEIFLFKQELYEHLNAALINKIFRECMNKK